MLNENTHTLLNTIMNFIGLNVMNVKKDNMTTRHEEQKSELIKKAREVNFNSFISEINYHLWLADFQNHLRLNYNLHVYVTPESVNPKMESYLYHIKREVDKKEDCVSFHFKGVYGNSYEEALQDGLIEALKHL